MTERDWYNLHNSPDSSAVDQFGDWNQVREQRVASGSSDHCNGAQAALRGFKNKVKAENKLEQMYGKKVWAGMSDEEKSRVLRLSLYGCQHHLRNICFNRGHKAVEAHIRSLLKDDLDKCRAAGVSCVDGKIDMCIRSVFKFFGNTTLLNFLSVGKEFRQWVSTHEEFKDELFQDCGRCDLGNRQDGISEHCFKLVTKVEMMLAFISDFHWSKTDCSYWPAIEISLESDVLKAQRMLYALVYSQIIEIHRTAVGKGGGEQEY